MTHRLKTMLVLLALTGCAVPQPDPIHHDAIPWDELFPTEDTTSADIAKDTAPPDAGEDTLV